MNPVDVLVIGAGPAGSSAAAVLAEHGRHVVIVEKEPFPRYRLGESLIPFCWYPLNRLGLTEKLDASGFIVHKHSVQFVSTQGKRSTPYYFFQHYDHPSSRTWQVVRSDFDQLLLDDALAKGATLRAETTATQLVKDEEGCVIGARVRAKDGTESEIHARVTLDASGRDVVAQTQNRWKIQDKDLRKVAIWSYFEGAERDPGYDAGATTIAYLPDKGWFWYLPLANDVVSVGVVAEADYLYRGTRDPDEIFAREVETQPWIAGHLAPGRKAKPCQVTRDFSYRSRHCAADGLVLAGDSFAFLDPVFSSGVFLALHMGVHAGDAIHEALAEGRVEASRFRAYGEKMCQAIEAMRSLVHAFYDVGFNFGAFLEQHPDMRGPLTDCLIGDLHADFTPLFTAMSEFAKIPEPLPHGGPAPSEPGSSPAPS